jgi:hypothetical protein
MESMMGLNQDLYELKMPLHIIEDDDYKCKLSATIEEINKETLESMYRVQDAIFRLFGKCEMIEIEANTINPAQQNIFLPLKAWNINLVGCYAIVRIHQRGLGGCFANMEILA